MRNLIIGALAFVAAVSCASSDAVVVGAEAVAAVPPAAKAAGGSRLARRGSNNDYRACKGTVCNAPAAGGSSSSSSLDLGDNLSGQYPWWTGVELGKAGAPIKIEAWLSYTCPDCAEHWKDIWLPLIDKYGDRVSFVHQPFALPYQPFSYDATQAAYAVYRLSGNNPKAFREWSNSMFKNQMFVYNSWDMTVRNVWDTLAGWGVPLGLNTADIINAMNGTVTTANYDAWYTARFARQRTLPGAPTFIINDWLPFDLDVGSWTVADWSKWIDANLPK